MYFRGYKYRNPPSPPPPPPPKGVVFKPPLALYPFQRVATLLINTVDPAQI